MSDDEIQVPEFSKEVVLSDLPTMGKTYKLVVSPEIYPLIAARLGIVSIGNCSGEVLLKANKSVISAKGSVRASLIRECVSSLETMDEIIEESFEVEFNRQLAKPESGNSSVNTEGSELDLTEIHLGDVFDVGELLIQQVSLAMESFPRKEGTSSLVEEFGTEASVSPFAVLQQDFDKQKTE